MYCLDANRLCESNITLLLTKWFILMYCDTFEEQTSCKLNMWLLHKVSTTFHTCKVFIELVYDDFIICMIQGESPRDYNLLSSILHSFLFMSFSPQGFSYKVFNEIISTQDYVLSSIFPIEVFGGWYWNIRYIVLFSLCEFFLLRFLI